MKVDLADVEHILTKYKIDQKLVEKIVDDAKQAVEDAKADGGDAGGKKLKYKHLIVASDPDGSAKAVLERTPMWVFKVPDDEQHTDVMPRFFKGVYDFNARSRKGRKNPIESVGDGIQAVGTKHFKPSKSPILTKEPVIVLVTNNIIPS